MDSGTVVSLRIVRNFEEHLFYRTLQEYMSTQCSFDIERSRMIYTANQMAGFYMKCGTKLKWIYIKPLALTTSQYLVVRSFRERELNLEVFRQLF